ncbi:hypothetical protein [Chitinolyticbacter albus]|uniref:hypothetical protein n=1 Tax=Chitinolyticbacter albus TaxID=2961951 RepID=UPI00210D8429|nr:hypothetical protein [Chitinolyticbacter albus]
MTDWLKSLARIPRFAMVFVWPSAQVWRQRGLDPYRCGSDDEANALLGRSDRASLVSLSLPGGLQARLGAWPRTSGIASALGMHWGQPYAESRQRVPRWR